MTLNLLLSVMQQLHYGEHHKVSSMLKKIQNENLLDPKVVWSEFHLEYNQEKKMYASCDWGSRIPAPLGLHAVRTYCSSQLDHEE